MTAAIQPRTTGPAHLSGSRFASCRRAPRFRNTRPAKRVAGQKTASRNFFRATPKPRRETAPQATGTHLESRTYRYVFAPGCVVAPNSGETGASIANNAFGNTTNMNCAPTSIRTIVTTATGTDPGIGAMQNQVAATQGRPGQNWNTQGTILGPNGSIYATTMTTVLNANGVPSYAQQNVAWPGGTPSMVSLTYNVMNSYWPSAVQVTFPVTLPNGTVVNAYHTVTVEPSSSYDVTVNNLTGQGGSITVPLSTFIRGQLNAGGTTFTVQPSMPVITPIDTRD